MNYTAMKINSYWEKLFRINVTYAELEYNTCGNGNQRQKTHNDNRPIRTQ